MGRMSFRLIQIRFSGRVDLPTKVLVLDGEKEFVVGSNGNAAMDFRSLRTRDQCRVATAFFRSRRHCLEHLIHHRVSEDVEPAIVGFM
jgi:hypothetical protein